MKIHELKKLIDKYGKEAKLIDVFNDLKSKEGGDNPCPLCGTKGVLWSMGGLDSPLGRLKTCTMCNGVGYTKKKLKPKFQMFGNYKVVAKWEDEVRKYEE